jgi:hypothetical protein
MSGIMDIIDKNTTDQKEMVKSRHGDNSLTKTPSVPTSKQTCTFTMARESGTTIVAAGQVLDFSHRPQGCQTDRDDFCLWSHIYRSSRPDPQAACASQVRREPTVSEDILFKCSGLLARKTAAQKR